jgi:ligand-binding sensor domain-containing protein
MHCSAKVVFFVSLSANILLGQQTSIGTWRNYTDMKSVRGVVQAGTSLWAATGGGVFAFDTVTQKLTKYANTEGLTSNDLSAIALDSLQRIWVGATDGSLSVFDPVRHRWVNIGDIRESEYIHKGIRSLIVKGDTVFVVSEFGVSVFIGSRWEFGDTYASFGFASSSPVACATVHGDRIWVGSGNSLATALRTSPNLSAPTSWTTYTALLDTLSVSSLAVFHDTLVIGTDEGLAYFTQSAYGVINSFIGKSVRDLQVSNDALFVLSNVGSGYTIDILPYALAEPRNIAGNSAVQAASFILFPSVWVGTTSRGIAREAPSTWVYEYPNGPNSNEFGSLVVDDNGILWCGSSPTSTAGFYRFNLSLAGSVQWKNFTSAEYPIMRRKGALFDGYYKVSRGANGSVWASSWGEGILEVKGDSIVRKLNHYTVPSLPGANLDPDLIDYAVAGDAAVDNEGNTWIANRNEIYGHSLLCLFADSSFSFFDNQYNASYGWFHTLVIDQYGTKWLAGDLPGLTLPNGGVYFFNENQDVTIYDVQRYGGWGHLSSADGLPSNIVFSLATDLEGSLWIGTSLGVAIISDPQFPEQRMSSFPLREQSIQAIAVDGVNNKWIGTREGVFVVNPDGTQLLATYTVASTQGQLADNDIRAIAIDQKRGIAYFGTEKGLSSLSIEAVQPSRSFSRLDIGPNPFTLPNDQPLIIRNLVANSSVKILSVSGNVIAQFLAQGGGRAFWDGRDRDGKLVPSGIYFVVAYSETSSQAATGKIAVIRK